MDFIALGLSNLWILSLLLLVIGLALVAQGRSRPHNPGIQAKEFYGGLIALAGALLGVYWTGFLYINGRIDKLYELLAQLSK